MEIKKFYHRYRDYILFNKNIIISGIFAFFTGALFTKYYSRIDANSFSNSLIMLAIEYSIYIPISAFLFYLDNKSKYVEPSTGKRDYKKIEYEVKKLIISFTISEIIYSISKVLIHFILLDLKIIEPYHASMLASLVAWLIFLLVINLC